MKNNIKSDLKKLKILLIGLTIIFFTYMVIIFTSLSLWVKLDTIYKMNWVIFLLNFTIIGIFIWYIWKRYPAEKKQKTNNTIMILFLGIIGLWLWFPNKKEIDKIIAK